MKKIITLCLSLCLTAALAAPAYALEYSIAPPKDFDFGGDTSIEVIHTADGGAMRNEDVSKNAALIPPVFGSESMNALHTGEYLTPNLAPRTLPTAGAIISGSGDVVTPGSTVSSGNGYQPAVLFTDVTSELYYKNGSLGRLDIPALDLSVRIYQGTDSKTLAKGIGHFEDTSIWEGNVCLAAHNRGANSYFGQIHTLNIGDKITLTTKLGTRTYHVTDVSKVSETDRSGLADSGENIRNSIAAPECFDRYFALTLENGAIPTATVRRMVFESSESELAEETMQVYREGKIVRLLEAIEAYAGAGDGRIIDVERTAIIIKVLSCNWSSFEVEDGGFFTVPFAWRLLYCVDPLLKRMDSKARASLMCSIFENEKVQVSTVALLLQDFENQLGRYAENARESADAVLPLDAVLKLEAIFKERAVKAIDSKVVLRQYHGLRFLWLLEQIAPETAADKKKSMVTDDVSLVKIIDECTSRGSVAVRIVAKTRTVDRDRLSEFVDLGEAYQRVKKFATENQFFDLPRDEQMSAVAFILIVERGPVESSLKDCIAEDAIMKALDQMESKIETDDTKRD